MNIESLIAIEDKRIFAEAVRRLDNVDPFDTAYDNLFSEIADEMPNIAKSIHIGLLCDLIFTYVSMRFDNADCVLSYCFDIHLQGRETIHISDVQKIPQLCELLHISFLNSKFTLNRRNSKVRVKSKEQLIELGAVYTQSHIAKQIVSSSFLSANCDLNGCKVLDFACGTGRFYENIVEMFEDKPKAILSNIYAIDIDPVALLVTKLKALSFFDSISASECRILSKHIVCKDALRIENPFFPDPLYVSYDDLDGLTEAGFDVIVSNPPYLVLKPNKAKAGVGEASTVQEQVNYFRNCGAYNFSIEGMLNLYQLSIERMLQMLKHNGVLGVICPSTLFGDVSATKLRKHLLLRNKILNIEFFAEKVPLFENVNQATNIFILKKGEKTDHISITEANDTFIVDLSLVEELFPSNLEIPSIHADEWDILRKLSKLKRLKEIKSIRNRRGELDLSLCKKFITFTPTSYRLVRGNMIGSDEVKDINGEFVSEDFISTRSTDYRSFDFNKRRLICQQISNGGLKRRLKFIFCEATDILGNSCNYLSADEETLKKLYLLLNSSILNWRFKITSSNNHINNYELAELPIVDLSLVDSSKQFNSQQELDQYVGKLYGLSAKQIKLIAI